MTTVFRIGKKKLGISEVVVGRPLFILNEIYSTEKTYVNNLNALVTVYQEPMQGMICLVILEGDDSSTIIVR